MFGPEPPPPLDLDDLPDGPEPGSFLASLSDIPDHGGLSINLVLNDKGGEIRLLVQRLGDTILVFENRCPHAGTPLNLFDDRFLDIKGESLICRTHGALFNPQTGKCTRGPCKGQYLRKIAVDIRDGGLYSA